jgi:Leucine-rich repeat (LRR) protein
MGCLQDLNLTINKLTELPREVTALSALEMLNIASNRLTALPPGMAALTALTALYAYSAPRPSAPLVAFTPTTHPLPHSERKYAMELRHVPTCTRRHI